MAPITKNCVSLRIILTIEGEVPITKNVIVTDENGKTYEPTYTRRAKGLVKCGRARWVDENTICLNSLATCPPNDVSADEINFTEDIKMSENTVKENVNVNVYDNEILERIDLIITQQDYIEKTIEAVVNMPVNESPEGGLDGQARGKALAEIAKNREQTNQAIIALLEKMYDTAHPEKEASVNTLLYRMIVNNRGDTDEIINLMKTMNTQNK